MRSRLAWWLIDDIQATEALTCSSPDRPFE